MSEDTFLFAVVAAILIAILVLVAALLILAYSRNVSSKYRLPPERKTRFGTEIQTLYHITAFGEEIKNGGEMLPGEGGVVGGGIYFASSVEHCMQKAHSKGWLVTARVFTGKSQKLDFNLFAFFGSFQYSFTWLQEHGFDSIRLDGMRTGVEYIVYNKDQVELIRVDQMAPISKLSQCLRLHRLKKR